MASILRRGDSYSVRFKYKDHAGRICEGWESFKTKKEAQDRKISVEKELLDGAFLVPDAMTVEEMLYKWIPIQSSKHKWAPKTYQSNLALIQNLIIPYIGEMQMQKLRPYHIEALYDTLSKTPCGQYVGGKRRDLSPKQQKRTLSGTTLHEVHQLLHNSFLLAVEWGILIKSPVPVEAPKKTTQERSIWEVEEMRAALDSMEDPILHLAVHLTLVGALREGEVAGLTLEDIDFDAANGMGTFTVNRSMQRVQKDTLAQVDKGCILRIFPDKLEGSKTSLILKDTKTEAVLPQHLYDRRPAGGTKAVAGTAEKGRSPRPGAVPQQRDAAATAQRSGGGAGAHPQKVPQMAGRTPGVPAHRLSRFTTFQCALSADNLRRRCESRTGDHRSRQCGYAGEHLRPYPAVLPCGAWQEV